MNDKNFFRNKVLLLNGVLSTIVVFAHGYNIDRYKNITWEFIPQLEFFVRFTLGDVAVPLFFMISAILFYRNYDWEKVGSKYKSRISSVLVPYLLWNTLYYIFFILLVLFPVSRGFMDTKTIPVDIRTLLQSVIFYQYNGVYWYMYQLILFIALSPLIYLLVKHKYGILLPVGLLILLYRIPAVPLSTKGLRIDSLIFWSIGAYLATHRKERIFSKSRFAVLYLGAALLLFFVRFYLEYFLKDLGINNYWLKVILIANVITAWFAFDVLEVKKEHEWMTMGFFVYSTHPLLVDMVKKGMAALLPDSNQMALLNFILTGTCSLLLCCLAAKLLRRWLPKCYALLTGGR